MSLSGALRSRVERWITGGNGSELSLSFGTVFVNELDNGISGGLRDRFVGGTLL